MKIILVRPQLAENIGMVARAMLNCGFDELRLVAPRDGWPQDRAFPASAGADFVLNKAAIFSSVADAIADLQTIYATTARQRDMEKDRISLPHLSIPTDQNPHTGILFGSEASGLTNQDVNFSDALLTIPVNPNFPSLNLAQSVFAVCYHVMTKLETVSNNSPIAPKKEFLYFLETLEESLDRKQFFHPPGKKPLMQQNLRNIFVKASLSSQEIQTLHGVLKSLQKKED